MTKTVTHSKYRRFRRWLGRLHPLRFWRGRRISHWYQDLERAPITNESWNPRGWFPVKIHFERDRIAWAHLGGETFRDPFFFQTIHRLICSRTPPRMQASTGAALLEQVDLFDGLAPNGFIFHVSRCGSTLVSNMCMRLPQNLVIAEATPINASLRHFMARSQSEEAVSWLHAVMAAFGATALPSQHHFIVKFSSWNLFLLPLIERAFPHVPRIILYRDPVEVLASNLLRHGGWLRERGRFNPATLIGAEAARGHKQWDEATHAIRILQGMYRAVLTHANQDTLLVNYEDIGPRVLPPILNHFGIQASAEEREHMAGALAVYSKDPRGRKAHKDDRSQKWSLLDEEVRAETQRLVGEPFELLQNHSARLS